MKFSIANLLSIVTIIALAIALILTTLQSNQILELTTADTGYSWQLRRSLIAKSPVWKDREQPPPIHLGEAIEISDEIVDELNTATKPFNVGNWRLGGITLSPLVGGPFGQDQNRERWCYLIQFFGLRLPSHMGPPERFDAIILMDGTIIAGEGSYRQKINDTMRVIYP